MMISTGTKVLKVVLSQAAMSCQELAIWTKTSNQWKK